MTRKKPTYDVDAELRAVRRNRAAHATEHTGRQDRSVPARTPHPLLAVEAADWDHRHRTPAGFSDADEAVPRAREATAISIRLPNALLALLKQFAEREGIGYQVLIKRWLDDRLRVERDRLRGLAPARTSRPRAPQFPLRDRDGDVHYEAA